MENLVARMEILGEVVTHGLNGMKLQTNGWEIGRNADGVKKSCIQLLFNHCDALVVMHHRSLMTAQIVGCVKSMEIVEFFLHPKMRKESGMTTPVLDQRHPLSVI